jgi:ribose/xylose/arabinose/galactoside ABC-type transport system permease subunit
VRARLITLLSSRLILLSAFAVVIGAGLTIASPYFLNLTNLLDMTQFSGVIGLLGIGQTLVILGGGGGIDLSSGAILSLAGVLMAIAVTHGVPVGLAAVLTPLFGALLGVGNGWIVAYLGFPPLIATLGTQYLFASVALGVTNGTPIAGFPQSFAWVGQGMVFGIPNQVLFVLVPVAILAWFLLNRTVFGRSVYAVGTNDQAAGLIGVDVRRTRLLLYTINGFLCGLGAIVMNSWLMNADPAAGDPYVLEAITVAVLGGTSIFGGEGTIGGTLMAVLVVTMLAFGFQIANVNSVMQLGILGFVLIAAVVANEGIRRALEGARRMLLPTRGEAPLPPGTG